jgi:hypothetical protein
MCLIPYLSHGAPPSCVKAREQACLRATVAHTRPSVNGCRHLDTDAPLYDIRIPFFRISA